MMTEKTGGFIVKQDGIYRVVPYYQPGQGWRESKTLELVISREAFLAAMAMWMDRDDSR